MLSLKDAQAIAKANAKRLKEELALNGPISLGPPPPSQQREYISDIIKRHSVLVEEHGRTRNGDVFYITIDDSQDPPVIGAEIFREPSVKKDGFESIEAAIQWVRAQ